MRLKLMLAISLGVLALGLAAGRAEPAAVTVGITNAIADVGLYVADKRGYFAEEGLKVKFVSFNAAARMIAPFASGELDVGGGGISAGLFNAVARGVKIRIVADKSTSAPGLTSSSLVVRQKLVDSGAYKHPSDLKGRRIAVPAPGTGTSTSLDHYFKSFGFGIANVELVSMAFPQMVQALQNDAVDAAFLTEPSFTRAMMGKLVQPVASDDQMFPDHQIAVTIFSDRFISADRAKAVGFMKAMLRGTRDYLAATPRGRLNGPGAEDMINILTEYTAIKDPTIYGRIGVHNVDPDGRINLQSLAEDLAFFQSQGLIEGKADLKEAVDPSIAEEAVRVLGPFQRAR
jgi:NitT/TauT family transport system substrate-binding protein